MFHLSIPLPDESQELQLIAPDNKKNHSLLPIILNEEISGFQKAVQNFEIPMELKADLVRLIRMTRPGNSIIPDQLSDHIQEGASPYVGLLLKRATKAFSIIRGKEKVEKQDLYDMAQRLVPDHIVLKPASLEKGITNEQVYQQMLKALKKIPEVTSNEDGRKIHSFQDTSSASNATMKKHKASEVQTRSFHKGKSFEEK